MDDIKDSLEKLTAALEAKSEELKQGSAIHVEDQTELAKKYLTPEALAAFDKKSTALIKMNADGTGFRCVYFAIRTPIQNVAQAVEKLALIANDLASRGLIDSVLAPISSVKLVRLPFELNSCAVVFYPLVPIDKAEEIEKQSEYAIEEGSTGKVLGSLEIPLPPGQFMAIARLTLSDTIQLENYDIPASIYNQVTQLLKVLPTGTKFLGANKCAFTDMSISYELKFFNRLLPDVKRVDLDLLREVAVVDGHLEQFNLFLGIRYFGKGGKQLVKGAT